MADAPLLPPAATNDPAPHSTLEFLLRRIRRNSDFPAMSEQILRVQALASSETESPDALTTEILKDVALTNKVLRIVNSAQFAHVGAGHINTVSRAVSLIGFSGVRNLATSLVLLDHMENKRHASKLRGLFAQALLAGNLASDLRPPHLQSEEVFIGALFQNLGHMLTEFYLPDEAEQVRTLMASPQGVAEEAATHSVLGLSYEALGQGVGKHWGLPDDLLRLMRKPLASAPMHQPHDAAEQLHWVAVAANDMANVFFHTPDDQWAQQLHKVAVRYAGVLGQTSTTLETLAQAARTRLADTAQAMGLQLASHLPGAHVLQAPAHPGTPANASPIPGGHPLEIASLTSPSGEQAGLRTPAPAASADAATSLLAQGIQDVTAALMDDHLSLNDVLRMVLETMFRALGFRQVVLCLKDPRSGILQGRLGLGQDAAQACKRFQVDPNEAHNLFAVVCQKGLDTLIHDAHDATVQHNLPAWYRQSIQARSLVLLPLHHKGSTFGLIYADHTQANGLTLDEKSLALLKTLRNQAVMAFRQAQLRH